MNGAAVGQKGRESDDDCYQSRCADAYGKPAHEIRGAVLLRRPAVDDSGDTDSADEAIGFEYGLVPVQTRRKSRVVEGELVTLAKWLGHERAVATFDDKDSIVEVDPLDDLDDFEVKLEIRWAHNAVLNEHDCLAFGRRFGCCCRRQSLLLMDLK